MRFIYSYIVNIRKHIQLSQESTNNYIQTSAIFSSNNSVFEGIMYTGFMIHLYYDCICHFVELTDADLIKYNTVRVCRRGLYGC